MAILHELTGAQEPLYLTAKIVITILLLGLTLVFTFLPWLLNRYMKRATNLMSLLTCLASGVIMGAFFFHILPHILVAHEHAHTPSEHGHGYSNASWNGMMMVPGKDDHDHDHDHDDDHEHHDGHHDNHNHGHGHENCTHHSHNEARKNHSNLSGLSSSPNLTYSHDAHEHKHEHEHEHGPAYPWGAFCAGASFFFLLILDRGLMPHHHCPKEAKIVEPEMEKNPQGPTAKENINELPQYEVAERREGEEECQSCHSSVVLGACHMDGMNETTSKTQAFLFVLVLSIHSFLEGLAMNSNQTESALVMFTVALALHKLLESFALGVSVFKAKFNWRVSLGLGIFYSILTPIGILCSLLNKNPKPIVEQVLNGLAAGSFLFVATLEMITPEFHRTNAFTKYKLTMASLGFALMAGVSVMHVYTHAH